MVLSPTLESKTVCIQKSAEIANLFPPGKSCYFRVSVVAFSLFSKSKVPHHSGIGEKSRIFLHRIPLLGVSNQCNPESENNFNSGALTRRANDIG